MERLKRLKRLKEKVSDYKFKMARALPYLNNVNQGSWADIVGDHAKYYKYLPAVIDIEKPKQVVELGSAGGTSALMILSHLPHDSMLYACSIPEPEGEFRFIQQPYPNLTLIRGDDLDLSIWKGVDLKKTDIWFFDTDHNYRQISSEMKLYDKFFKKGALVFWDDINLNDGMRKAWSEVKYPKLDLPDWHSYKNTGFGVFTV